MIIHATPSIRTRRDSGPGDASQDAPNVNDIAASRAAWVMTKGRIVWVDGEPRYRAEGWPEPQMPMPKPLPQLDPRQRQQRPPAVMIELDFISGAIA